MPRFVLPFYFITIIFLFFRGNNVPENKELMPGNEKAAPKEITTTGYIPLLGSIELDTQAFRLAFSGYQELLEKNLLKNDSLLTIVDYSKTSDKERLFIIDIKNRKIVDKSLVAHGQQSGTLLAQKFSNRKQSHMSSLGLFLTSSTYFGKHGYSLRIDGLEKGINDNARERAIVFHGANYVSRNYIGQNGRLGRSFGCPALPYEKNSEIIDRIKNGSCLFIYHPSLVSSQASFVR
jgi:hypothetical protein